MWFSWFVLQLHFVQKRVFLHRSHHRQHVEACLSQQVAQVGDGGVRGDVGGEAPLPLRLSELEGAAQLVQSVSAHHGPDEHAIRFQDLMDLKSDG